MAPGQGETEAQSTSENPASVEAATAADSMPDEKMPPNEATAAGAADDGKLGDDDAQPLSGDADAGELGKAAETKVDMGPVGAAAAAPQDNKYRALTKAELQKYATDPFWIRVRWALFILFWVAWLAMLAVSVVIIVMAPKCPTPPPKQWWQKAPIYSVKTATFKDSDNDGKGDLKGVESQLERLALLGAGSVLLDPIHGAEGGVDKAVGSQADLEALVAAANEQGLKIVLSPPQPFGPLTAASKATLSSLLDLGVAGFAVDVGGRAVADVEADLKAYRALLDAKTAADAYNPRILIAGGVGADAKAFYGGDVVDNVGALVHMPLSYSPADELKSTADYTAQKLRTAFVDYLARVTAFADGSHESIELDDPWPNFALRTPGSPAAFAPELADAMNMVLMLLPGTPVTAAGEESGVVGDKVLAVELDLDDAHAQIYARLSKLRTNDALLFGTTRFNVSDDADVFWYTRLKKGNPGYIVAVNFGDDDARVDMCARAEEGEPCSGNLANKGTVYAVSVAAAVEAAAVEAAAVEAAGDEAAGDEAEGDAPKETIEIGTQLPFDNVPLKPKQGIVISFVPKFAV